MPQRSDGHPSALLSPGSALRRSIDPACPARFGSRNVFTGRWDRAPAMIPMPKNFSIRPKPSRVAPVLSPPPPSRRPAASMPRSVPPAPTPHALETALRLTVSDTNTIKQKLRPTSLVHSPVTTTNRNRDHSHSYFGAGVSFGSGGPTSALTSRPDPPVGPHRSAPRSRTRARQDQWAPAGEAVVVSGARPRSAWGDLHIRGPTGDDSGSGRGGQLD